MRVERGNPAPQDIGCMKFQRKKRRRNFNRTIGLRDLLKKEEKMKKFRLALFLGLVVLFRLPAAVAGFEQGGKTLKTQPLSGGTVGALFAALDKLDKDFNANKAQVLTDKTKRMQSIRSLATQIKTGAASLVSAIRANKEEEAFNEMVMAQASKVPGSVASDIRAAGGAVALLSQAASIVDRDIDLFDRALKADAGGGPSVAWLSAVLSVREAEAGWIRYTACTGFWYVVSVGYGTQHAYTSCNSFS